MAAVKQTILEILEKKEGLTKDELASEVASKVGTSERVVKAVITKMINKGELKEKGGKIYKA